jgi:hypothetical protein
LTDLAEGVAPVELEELELAFPGFIVTERVGNLLQDQNDPNACEHSFDHAGGKIVRDDACFEKTSGKLHDAAKYDRQKINFEAYGFDPCGDHDC